MTALERLQFAIRNLPGILAGIADAEAGKRPTPERWCKKEIIGHLIDSASNNHQRFVRAQIVGKLEFPRYEQEAWVRVQQYQSAKWLDLIDLWRAYNLHLLHVVTCMSDEGRRSTCRIGDGREVMLGEMFEECVNHIEHHLRKMLGEWPVSGNDM